MSWIFHPLLYLLASSTRQELARQVQYLKTENQILRSKLPKKITVTDDERRKLVKAGKKLGKAIKELVAIVTPRTFARWLSGTEEPAKKKPARKPGRPRLPEEIRELVVKIAKETGWGYTRILGELRKLGYRKISRQTVVNILKEHGFDPGPKRGKGSWDEFLKIHAQTLWACDFLSKKTWTLGGLVDMYLLVFIHVGSRRVWISPATVQPDSAWVAQQARNVSTMFQEEEHPPTWVMHDADTKFTKQFDAILESEGLKVKRHTPRSPNLNAYVERLIQTIQQECLDHFVVIGEQHLNHIVREFMAHYHDERPHQGLGNVPIIEASASAESGRPAVGAIIRRDRLGGLLKHYERRAA
ncbi:MAG: integrase core domain-containing protein [Planctomycetaceae bacterium]